MGVKKVIKKSFTAGFNPKRWVGVDHIKDNGRVIGHLFTSLFKQESKKVKPESFEAAKARLNLTEADLQKRVQQGKYVIIFCLFAALLAFAYMIYLVMHHFYLPGIVTLMISLLALVYAYREHFNIFQIKQRRLGCTFGQWFDGTFKRSK